MWPWKKTSYTPGCLAICLTTARNLWGKYPELSWAQMERIARKAAVAGSKADGERNLIDRIEVSFTAQLQSKAHLARGDERSRVLYFVEHWPA